MKKFTFACFTLLLTLFLGIAAACSVKLYKIQFVDGETTVKLIRSEGNESIALPDPLFENHDGETFRGWFFDEGIWTKEMTEDFYLESDLTTDVTVYAYWSKDQTPPGEDTPPDGQTPTVTFITNGGSAVSPVQVENIAAEPQTERAHYRFDGWFTDASFSGERVTFPYAVTQDTSLYAKWTQTEFYVTFEENGGDAVADGWFGKIEAEPHAERSGFIFGGWFIDASFPGGRVTFPYAVTQTTTLYAKWTPQPQLLGIEGFAISGTTASASCTSDKDSVNIADAVTVTEGATWKVYYDEDLRTEADASALPLNAGINRFYLQVSAAGQSAVYTLAIEQTDGYALTVYENGEPSASVYANKGDTFASPLPQIYTQEKNFTFDGEYFADEAMTQPFTDFTASGDKTVYLKVWYTGYEYSSFIFTIQGALKSDLPILYAKIPSMIGSSPIYFLNSSFQNDFDFKKNLQEVKIEAGIRTIENSAFSQSDVLRKVTLPDGIMLAGGVFRDCPMLSEMVCDGAIRSSSTNFSGTALYNDPANWENGAFYIGNYLAGYNEQKAESLDLTVRSGTVSVAGSACDGSSLQSVDFGNSVKYIGAYAFDGCSSLASVTGMDAVESIGENAFRNTPFAPADDSTPANTLYYLNNWLIAAHKFSGTLTLRSGTVGIADSVFKSNADITSVDFGDSLRYIGKYAFGSDSSGKGMLTEVQFPASLRSVDESAFSYQSKITRISFGENLTFIGKNAFRFCSSIAEVLLPESLQTVQCWAFSATAPSAKLFLENTLENIYAEKEWSGFGANKAICYEYSETPKTGNYWRYVDGVPTVWETA